MGYDLIWNGICCSMGWDGIWYDMVWYMVYGVIYPAYHIYLHLLRSALPSHIVPETDTFVPSIRTEKKTEDNDMKICTLFMSLSSVFFSVCTRGDEGLRLVLERLDLGSLTAQSLRSKGKYLLRVVAVSSTEIQSPSEIVVSVCMGEGVGCKKRERRRERDKWKKDCGVTDGHVLSRGRFGRNICENDQKINKASLSLTFMSNIRKLVTQDNRKHSAITTRS